MFFLYFVNIRVFVSICKTYFQSQKFSKHEINQTGKKTVLINKYMYFDGFGHIFVRYSLFWVKKHGFFFKTTDFSRKLGKI